MKPRTISATILAVAMLVIGAVVASRLQDKPDDEPDEKQTDESSEEATSILAWLLEFAGISDAPSALRSVVHGPASGDIWIADLNDPSRSVRLTRVGNFRSPIFAAEGRAILALRGDHLVRVPLDGGEPKILWSVPGVAKLVGLAKSDPERVLILTGEDDPGVLALETGEIEVLPFDRSTRENRILVAHVEDWRRSYGDTELSTDTVTRREPGRVREWSEVYVRRGDGDRVQISRCDGDDCGQPSLAPDGRRVAFVRSEKG